MDWRLRAWLAEWRPFQGRKRFCLGWAISVAGLVLFAPFVAFIALLIHTSGSPG